MATKLNDFNTDLEFSAQASDEFFWEAVYRKAFPDFMSMLLCDKNCQGQHLGIDRLIYLRTGKTLAIDEKKRREKWDDVLIEYQHVFDNGDVKIGWINKELIIDYLAYAFMPTKTVLLYDWQILKKAWEENKTEWIEKYNPVKAKNKNYVTYSIPVPFKELHRQISICRVIKV